jgi:23S rRNA pseudouridine1911/1915/1917 synthase
MKHSLSFVADHSHAGERLDIFLAQQALDISRSRIKHLILQRQVTVNDQPVKPHYLLKTGDRIQFRLPEPKSEQVLPEAIPLDIVYEDSCLIVVNKSAGMVVHPGAGNYSGTLVSALLAHCGKLSNIGGPIRPGIVHRLDKNTSGLLVVAKTDAAHLALGQQIAQRSINRIYWGLAAGEIRQAQGDIEIPLGRHVVNRKKISPLTRRGKPARTSFEVLERFPRASLLKLKLYTGRTHQIRAHLAHIGYPILGDRVYKGSARLTFNIDSERREIFIPRQALHAKILGFYHPENAKYLEFEAPLAQDMQQVIEQLRGLRNAKLNR